MPCILGCPKPSGAVLGCHLAYPILPTAICSYSQQEPPHIPSTIMTSDVEMKVKKPKSKKSEKAAAETPVKEKKTKVADGSSKKKKRKADADDEGAAAVVEVVRP